MTYGSRDSPPSLPPFRKNGKKETRGEERKRQEWEEGGGKGGERHTQWRLGRDDRGYCIVFSFGTNDLPCFPLYCRELLQSPQKHVRGCESHRESATEGRGWRRERETGGTTDGGGGGGGGVERKGEPYDMGGITYLWASGTGTEANFKQILVGNNVRAIGT